MIKILALDIATKCGWACGPSDAPVPQFGMHRLPSGANGENGEAFYVFRETLVRTLKAERPDFVVFECPILPSDRTGIRVLRRLYTLAGIVEEVCYGAYEVREEHLQSIKKFVTGSGRAEKRDVIAAVNRMFGLELTGAQDNEADAIALWCLAVHKLDEPNAQRWALGNLGTGAPPVAPRQKRTRANAASRA